MTVMTATRRALWKSIAQTLTEQIARGHHARGARLPTKTELETRFSVNRHALRHALGALADQGLTRSRCVGELFVTSHPTE